MKVPEIFEPIDVLRRIQEQKSPCKVDFKPIPSLDFDQISIGHLVERNCSFLFSGRRVNTMKD